MPRGLVVGLVIVLVLAVASGGILAGATLSDGGDDDINAAMEEMLADEGVFEDLDDMLTDEDLLKQEEQSGAPSEDPIVGVSLFDASGEVVVQEVVRGSPAATAGLEKDDVIVAVEDTPVQTRDDVAAIVGESEKGDVLTFTVSRDDEELKIDVRVAERAPQSRRSHPSTIGVTWCCWLPVGRATKPGLSRGFHAGLAEAVG